MATVVLEIIGVEPALMQKVAQLMHGLAYDVLPRMQRNAKRVGLWGVELPEQPTWRPR